MLAGYISQLWRLPRRTAEVASGYPLNVTSGSPRHAVLVTSSTVAPPAAFPTVEFDVFSTRLGIETKISEIVGKLESRR